MPKKSRASNKKSAVKPAATAMKAPQNLKPTQELPTKQSNIFKQILTKTYKKGVKLADSILKTFPENGETLSMKGLLLTGLDRGEEGRPLVKLGVRYNIKSHVCWHVYGLMHRADRNYDEAVKCYLNALKIDPENLAILKDLGVMQIQIRDKPGFLETRRQILMLKSNNNSNWLAYAIANHISGNFPTALKVLESYEDSVDKSSPTYEISELVLYKNMILEESGDIQAALNHLTACERDGMILDTMECKRKKALFYLRLEMFDAARSMYMKLLNENCENYEFYTGLLRAYQYDGEKEEDEERIVSLFVKLQNNFPRANAPVRLMLDYCSGERFLEEIDAYCKKRLRKGVPSLFRDICSLYSDSAKKAVIGELLLAYATEPWAEGESPSTKLWSLYCLASHYVFVGELENAIRVIDQAINHTPTCIECWLLKGKILKRSGKHEEAYGVIDEARRMDLADRYLNTKATKYAFRAGLVNKAVETVGLFLKDEDKLKTLSDSQTIWFERAAGEAYLEKKDYGSALRFFYSILDHFEAIADDQFDFHTYCLRKVTLRHYVRTLQFEDTLYSQREFVRATVRVIEICCALHDETLAQKERAAEIENMNAEDRKKEKAKDKRKKRSEKKNDSEFLDRAMKEGPLEEATKHLGKLVTSDWDMHVCLLAANVFLKKHKFLLVIKALQRACGLDRTNHELKDFVGRIADKCMSITYKKNINPTAFVAGKSMEDVVERVFTQKVQELKETVGL